MFPAEGVAAEPRALPGTPAGKIAQQLDQHLGRLHHRRKRLPPSQRLHTLADDWRGWRLTKQRVDLAPKCDGIVGDIDTRRGGESLEPHECARGGDNRPAREQRLRGFEV